MFCPGSHHPGANQANLLLLSSILTLRDGQLELLLASGDIPVLTGTDNSNKFLTFHQDTFPWISYALDYLEATITQFKY